MVQYSKNMFFAQMSGYRGCIFPPGMCLHTAGLYKQEAPRSRFTPWGMKLEDMIRLCGRDLVQKDTHDMHQSCTKLNILEK